MDMKTKHTPGPWDAWIENSKWGITGPGAAACMVLRVGNEYGNLLVQIGSASSEAIALATGNSVEKAHANARLIAAAPTLYIEAFELIGDLDPENMDRRFDGLRAAIAKAEGR